ncbi:tripartite tricarboxylate transporter substrate-binding protein [Cupriavidus taiwanensis]|uniref:Bug family tripartite tricarboxylate transporter substrate binding protein n=1 Tax=Cupriavidus taiwanensis TaxID=164546 RepID=UPI000E17A7A4|nr:tripartite tricarboxylate transporter substrate-binding protein [Cupriavidus taiwanensis]SPA38385.1 conserved hypothetical protein [Cupriavidus taiwanensis]
MFDSYGSAGPNVKAGRLRVLGVTSSRRLDVLPDAPTLEEEGVARYAYDLWLGLFAPSGTPKEVIDKLSVTLRSVLQTKRVMERAHEEGGQVAMLSPEQFDMQLKRELADMEKLTRSLGFVRE